MKIRIFAGVLFLLGASILLYPSVSAYLNSQNQAKVVEDYSNQVKQMNDAETEKELQKAREFNENLKRTVVIDPFTEEILNHITLIRELAGDRAALRALHFVCENERVKKEVDALRKDNFPKFLANVKESGDSSFKYLQNVYTCHDVQHQNVSIALALSDVIFGEKGVCRVHGGGFAGTIQAFVPNYLVPDYQKEMDTIFGKGSCEVLKIRKYGGIKVL